jgi:16S rRNA (guanine527-N7)-methyltransferase
MNFEETPSIDVSRETRERLEIFADLIRKWNPRINLVSRRSLDDLWQRHIVDSIQVFRSLEASGHWVDIGSGGGLPGVVIALIAVEESPDLQVTLIESDQRKSAFLRTAARETGASFRVISDRIEKVEPQNADTLSARALADLTALMGFAERHLSENGTCVFPKGATWQKELSAARQEWNFEATGVKSLTDSEAVILKLRGISRV